MKRIAFASTVGLGLVGIGIAVNHCEPSSRDNLSNALSGPQVDNAISNVKKDAIKVVDSGIPKQDTKLREQPVQDKMEEEFWGVAAELEEDLNGHLGNFCVLEPDWRDAEHASLNCTKDGYRFSIVLAEVSISGSTKPSPYHVVATRFGLYNPEISGRPVEREIELLANSQEELEDQAVLAVDELFVEVLE